MLLFLYYSLLVSSSNSSSNGTRRTLIVARKNDSALRFGTHFCLPAQWSLLSMSRPLRRRCGLFSLRTGEAEQTADAARFCRCACSFHAITGTEGLFLRHECHCALNYLLQTLMLLSPALISGATARTRTRLITVLNRVPDQHCLVPSTQYLACLPTFSHLQRCL